MGSSSSPQRQSHRTRPIRPAGKLPERLDAAVQWPNVERFGEPHLSKSSAWQRVMAIGEGGKSATAKNGQDAFKLTLQSRFVHASSVAAG
jgi:hypothetical protein